MGGDEGKKSGILSEEVERKSLCGNDSGKEEEICEIGAVTAEDKYRKG